MGVFPCVGVQNQSEIVKWKPSTIGVPEITMDDQRLKFEIYTSLKRKSPATGNRYPGGYIHFPADYHEDYYKQMVAEDVVEIIDARGFKKTMIVNEKQRRNEVLDCTKMALAGLYFNYIAYFKIWNSTRKLKKQKEILPDWALYWSLFGDDKATEVELEEKNKK
jgi:phage terminase large subunit GpA-like protein